MNRQRQQELDTALNGLESSIERLSKQYEKRRIKRQKILSQRRHNGRYSRGTAEEEEEEEVIQIIIKRSKRIISDIMNHIKHLVYDHASKRLSLQCGMECLQQKVWPQVLSRLQYAFRTHHGHGGNSNNNNNKTSHTMTTTIVRDTLRHFFEQYLRFRDGIVLLVSGECRHIGDCQRAKRCKRESRNTQNRESESKSESSNFDFSSRLTISSSRRDGYTQLYNHKLTYSGTGYDEFNEASVGLRVRLCRALFILANPHRYLNYKNNHELEEEGETNQSFNLNRTLQQEEQHYMNIVPTEKLDTIWESLMERGAGLIDTLMDTMVQEVNDASKSLAKEWKARIESDLIRTVRTHHHHSKTSSSVPVSVSVSVSAVDKFEHLVCRIGNAEYRFERRASNFRIMDKHGVLPNNLCTPKDWFKIMTLPSLPPQLSSSSSKSSSITSIHSSNLKSKQSNTKQKLQKNKSLSSSSTTTTTTSINQSSKSKTQATNINRKRRRVFEESSSSSSDNDEDDHHQNQKGKPCTHHKKSKDLDKHSITTTTNNNNNSSSNNSNTPTTTSPNSGLHVRVQTKQKPSSVNSSLNDIKVQLGVNAESLASAREGLAQEELNTTIHATAIDNHIPIEHNIHKHTVPTQSSVTAGRTNTGTNNTLVRIPNDPHFDAPSFTSTSLSSLSSSRTHGRTPKTIPTKKTKNNTQSQKQSSNSNTNHNTYTTKPASNEKSRKNITTTFQPCGDMLLPQIINYKGEKVPELKYPTLPPELPPQYKYLLETNPELFLTWS